MVISDFAYADVAFDGYKPPSFLASPGASDVGVEFTTMSKGYNMAGWRVGFCAGNAEMIRAWARSRPITITACSRRFKSPRSWPCVIRMPRSKNNRASIKAGAMCWSRACDALAGKSLRRKPACSCGRRFPSRWASKMSTMDFAMMLLEKGDVAVSPGSGFGPAGEGYLRHGPGRKRKPPPPSRSADRPVPFQRQPAGNGQHRGVTFRLSSDKS